MQPTAGRRTALALLGWWSPLPFQRKATAAFG
jgi:hypothetical protein